MRTAHTLTAALLLTLATACSIADATGPDHPDWQADDNAYFACEDLAKYANDGYPIASRQERMDDLNRWANRSNDTRIVEQGATVARTAASPDDTFQLAMDTMAATCLDLGFEAAQQ